MRTSHYKGKHASNIHELLSGTSNTITGTGCYLVVSKMYTFRFCGILPARAKRSVVFPEPGGPSNKVNLTIRQV